MSGGNEVKLVVTAVLIACTALLLLGAVFVFATDAGVRWATSGAVTPSLWLLSFTYIAFATALLIRLISRALDSDVSPLAIRVRNATALSILIAIYGYWILPSRIRVSWIASGVAMALLIQFGTYIFARVRRRVLEQLVATTPLMSKLDYISASFERYFERHSAAYIALPVGGVVGVLISGVRRVTEPDEMLRLSICSILCVLAAFLLVQLIQGCHMVASRFCVIDNSITKSDVKFEGEAPRRLLVHCPEPSATREERLTTLVDAGAMATAIRNLYLYNQFQQLAVALPVFVAAIFLFGVQLKWTFIFLGIVVVVVAMAQIPYVIGQLGTHSLLLSTRRGVDREKLADDLRKFAPLYPKAAAWLACTGSGTVGAIGVKLLDGLLPKL